MQTWFKILKSRFLYVSNYFFTGALYILTDLVIIRFFENCCTSDEYNRENEQNNLWSTREWKTIRMKNKLSENRITITKIDKERISHTHNRI
jgi:hypothetical protein